MSVKTLLTMLLAAAALFLAPFALYWFALDAQPAGNYEPVPAGVELRTP
jgi:hypothetical protein